MYTAGIDIGTTSICVVVTGIADGRVAAVRSMANDASLYSESDWERTQSAERITAVVRALIEACGDVWNDVRTIGISCQMHGVLYVNEEGKAVSPLYTWQDGRGDLPARSGGTYASELQACTGYELHTGYGLTTHYYLTEQAQIPRGAVKLCTIGDYVAMQLAGAKTPRIDSSNAASLGLYDLQAGRFDREQAEAAGMDAGYLPELANGSPIAGETADGKRVHWAIGDNQASFLGAVPAFEGTLLLNIGTGSQVSVYSPRYLTCPRLETRPFMDGGYLLVGASLSGGKSYELLERFFREVVAVFGGDAQRTLYETMNRLAEEALADPAAGLRVGTQFYGTREEPGRRGTIAGIGPDNFHPRALTAACLHGILEELDGYTKELPPAVIAGLTRLAASGNGIRKNKALQRMAAAQWALPLSVAGVNEEAAFGAAVHAAVGSGYFGNYEKALQTMQRSDSYDNETCHHSHDPGNGG
ncbi:sedoheptulokinase [Paenibacillus sp. GCM10023248]|uniref:sedoheptulokinase n=1 Tax=unclassified Paenibacillus TaxID=185978 RepID=UPI002379F77D|nr:FGGY family carbohydrate kinase [Paenibacillus sp. MAHUQ-63]MDD9267374.1 FGGY family carbohydrate kinase [Paenibacillus sp. MAHUQ-63]